MIFPVFEGSDGLSLGSFILEFYQM